MNYYDRLFIEKEDLDNRIELLERFLESDKFNEVSREQQVLLNMQFKAMQLYRVILQCRIDKLGGVK